MNENRILPQKPAFATTYVSFWYLPQIVDKGVISLNSLITPLPSIESVRTLQYLE